MRAWRLAGLGLCGALVAGAAGAQEIPPITASSLYEVRGGASWFIDANPRVRERDVFVNAEILFASPFPTHDSPFLDALLRPRPAIGTTVATAGGTSEVYAGLTWDFPLIGGFFLDASFGGTWHNGQLDMATGGHHPLLGTRFLFRESVGIGYSFNRHWNVIVGIDHASNANLGSYNDGLTHVGAVVGYRF